MSHYVYIIECTNGSYYTGYTTDLERRYQEHVAGSNKCKYTRAFPPRALLAHWCFDSKNEALSFEYALKQKSRKEKDQLIACNGQSL